MRNVVDTGGMETVCQVQRDDLATKDFYSFMFPLKQRVYVHYFTQKT